MVVLYYAPLTFYDSVLLFILLGLLFNTYGVHFPPENRADWLSPTNVDVLGFMGDSCCLHCRESVQKRDPDDHSTAATHHLIILTLSLQNPLLTLIIYSRSFVFFVSWNMTPLLWTTLFWRLHRSYFSYTCFQTPWFVLLNFKNKKPNNVLRKKKPQTERPHRNSLDIISFSKIVLSKQYLIHWNVF